GQLIVDGRPHKHDALLQQPAVDVVRPLAAVRGALDHVGDVVHAVDLLSCLGRDRPVCPSNRTAGGKGYGKPAAKPAKKVARRSVTFRAARSSTYLGTLSRGLE